MPIKPNIVLVHPDAVVELVEQAAEACQPT
jgi:hypothetical protein